MAVPMLIGADGSYSSSGPWQFIDVDGNRVNVARNYHSVATYGAKCDGRVVSDGTISSRTGAGNTTVTSATIAFTQADVGKRFAINTTVVTVAYPIPHGYIVSVESATSATVYVPATVAAIASGGSLLVVSDDSVAVIAAITAATNTGGNVFIPPGICGFGSAAGALISIPDGVNLVGAGNSRGDTFKFVSKGSCLVCVTESYAVDAFVELAGSGSAIQDINIDAARRVDYTVQVTGSLCSIKNSTIARAVTTGLYATGGSNLIMGNHLYNGFAGVVVEMFGDSMLKDNYIYGSGHTFTNVKVNGPTDDFEVSGNHFYKGGWGTTITSVTGPNLQLYQYSTTDMAGGIIANNVFDTCEGNHIEVTIFNSAATLPIRALTISANEFFQPQAFTTDTYSCIKLSAGTGGANNVTMRGISITGNVGKGFQSGSRAYKSFIDYSKDAGSTIIGDVVVGNAIDNCNLLYSGTAHTQAYTAGNATIAGVGTTVAVG